VLPQSPSKHLVFACVCHNLKTVNAICATCGTQFAESGVPPAHCPICEDERQYVGLDGQKWTTLDELRNSHSLKLAQEEPDLSSWSIEPHFAIGQRAFLLQTAAGNVLWDCVSLLNDGAIDQIRAAGGVTCLCISHPHYYTTMVEWSRALGNIPIYLHRHDERWAMRRDQCIHFWEGETTKLPGGLTLIRCGGHFAGATVLHWPAGADGRGVLLSGDTIQIVPDRHHVSFMYSYPNYIPLNRPAVEKILGAVEPFTFDRIYGAFPKMTIESGAKQAVQISAERYYRAISSSSSA
jgi:glyoxylase-like metal-dependent hydrolase (beta-lactamase superfamily II)